MLDDILQNAHLHHVQINSPDPKALAEFYAKAMDFEASKLDTDLWLCRAKDRNLLIGKKSDDRVLAYGAYQFENEAGLVALKERLARSKVEVVSPPPNLFDDHAVGVIDPDCNLMVFGHASTFASSNNKGLANTRLQHLVIATDESKPMVEFYRNIVGFVMSDEVWDGEGGLTSAFLRADQEHHCFAIFLAPEKRLDHLCFETDSWNDIRDWADRITQMGIEIQWGPGRHGPGNNLFFFLNDPDGNWIELSAELEVKKPGDLPGQWKHEPRTLNLWGMAKMRI